MREDVKANGGTNENRTNMTNKASTKPVKPPKGARPKSAAKVMAEKRPRGRRPTYDRSVIIPQILARIATGETLREICRGEGMPSWETIYDWLDVDPAFVTAYARARDRGEEAIAQECLEIADSAKNDWMEANGKDDIGYKLNGEHVQRSKLRIETRLKLLAKWNPKKWGEKVDLNHGVQPDNPLAKLFEQVSGTPLKPSEN